MDSKPYYNSITENKAAFDKVRFELEKMSKEAPNARIRTVADTSLAQLKLVMDICQHVSDAEKKQ